jgi:glycogen operon protein
MTGADWNDAPASVLGMHLDHPDDEVLVWFNRRIDTVPARLPPGGWEVGFESDPTETPIAGDVIILPARSVVALVRAGIPPDQPQELPPSRPQEVPPAPTPPEQPQPKPDDLPGNPPQELPDQKPPEEAPKEPRPS